MISGPEGKERILTPDLAKIKAKHEYINSLSTKILHKIIRLSREQSGVILAAMLKPLTAEQLQSLYQHFEGLRWNMTSDTTHENREAISAAHEHIQAANLKMKQSSKHPIPAV